MQQRGQRKLIVSKEPNTLGTQAKTCQNNQPAKEAHRELLATAKEIHLLTNPKIRQAGGIHHPAMVKVVDN